MKGIGNINKQIKLFILKFVRWLTGIAKRMGIRPTRQQVLFVAQNELTIAYMKEIWKRIKDDRLSLYVTFDNKIDRKVVTGETAAFTASANRIRRINYKAAMIWPWDLIIFANVDKTWSSFSSMSQRLWIPHGIDAGRLCESGKDIAWAEWLYEKDGTPAFDLIFSVNELSKKYGERECPAYQGKIVCVGDLRFDNLLDAYQRRGHIRKELGIPEEKKVVLLISSWGPRSLLHTIGRQLYQECSCLAGDYHFIITAHHNNYYKDKSWIDVVEKQAEWGATIIKPTDDWTRFMAVSDVLITDYTSMSLYFIPLLKPIISIPIPPDLGVPGSAMYRMESLSTQLSSPDKLRDVLETAFSSEIVENHREFAREIVSYQGQSWIETGRRIYDLLSMSVPNHNSNELSDK